MESVAGFPWNHWPVWCGICRIGIESFNPMILDESFVPSTTLDVMSCFTDKPAVRLGIPSVLARIISAPPLLFSASRVLISGRLSCASRCRWARSLVKDLADSRFHVSTGSSSRGSPIKCKSFVRFCLRSFSMANFLPALLASSTLARFISSSGISPASNRSLVT